jgi:Na+-transporting NADH:ubiquinone oxidoreductase subunit NqrB
MHVWLAAVEISKDVVMNKVLFQVTVSLLGPQSHPRHFLFSEYMFKTFLMMDMPHFFPWSVG